MSTNKFSDNNTNTDNNNNDIIYSEYFWKD